MCIHFSWPERAGKLLPELADVVCAHELNWSFDGSSRSTSKLNHRFYFVPAIIFSCQNPTLSGISAFHCSLSSFPLLRESPRTSNAMRNGLPIARIRTQMRWPAWLIEIGSGKQQPRNSWTLSALPTAKLGSYPGLSRQLPESIPKLVVVGQQQQQGTRRKSIIFSLFYNQGGKKGTQASNPFLHKQNDDVPLVLFFPYHDDLRNASCNPQSNL